MIDWNAAKVATNLVGLVLAGLAMASVLVALGTYVALYVSPVLAFAFVVAIVLGVFWMIIYETERR